MTPPDPPTPPPARGSLLVDRELAGLVARGRVRPAEGAPAIRADADGQLQCASLDLRLGPRIARLRAGFLPGRAPLEERLAELALEHGSLEGEGTVLEPGAVHLVRLDEELDLPPDVAARFNPRSSTGRCDVFTRVLVPGHPRFNEAPAGYRGPLWLEIASLSFPVRLRRGDRLCQMRLQRGDPALTYAELVEEHARTPLVLDDEGPLPPRRVRFAPDGSIELHLGLAGREPAGWRARAGTGVLDFGAEGAHAAAEFFEPVHARDGHCILPPGGFTIFASRERVRVPPHLAAEMVPVDVEIGELRNNYAGFFDNGFGWRDDDGAGPGGTPAVLPGGTPAVLEVRAHDLPFLAEEGQVFFRLRFFRASSVPDRLYGEGRSGSSYQAQDLTLARVFRPG